MSYSRSFSKRVAVHYSGSVSYPASQHGGSVSYSGTAYEDVIVNINVDTDSFDSSVQRCSNTVGVLTGAVVATEGAQVLSIKNNAKKIGQTIIAGFFKTVRSEISQQIMELKNKIDATLMHLDGLAKRCVDKQHQMETDYARLSGRYVKIFEELNAELKNRIHEVDRPVFVLKKTCDENASRYSASDLVGTVAVSGGENGRLETMISASVAKRNALDTIAAINMFLAKQKRTEGILQHCILPEGRSGGYYLPVCYIETSNEADRIDREVYCPDAVQAIDKGAMKELLSGKEWDGMDRRDAEQVRLYFNSELGSHYGTGSDEHDSRVKDCMSRLFKL